MHRLFSLLLVPLLLFAACGRPTSSDVRKMLNKKGAVSAVPATIGVNGGEITYGRKGSGDLHGYLALPATSGPHPAVVLVHERWGLDDYMRENARKFAKLGYVALAVDLYSESTTDPAVAQWLAAGVQRDAPGALDNLEQAVTYLKNRSDVDDDRVASVGWDFGGAWAYQMAKNDLGVKATVMYYGQFGVDDDVSQMKADILGHFGEADRTITIDDVHEFQATLQTRNGLHDVYIYPNADNGFANPSSPAYDKQAAKIAWERTVNFLTTSLGTPPNPR